MRPYDALVIGASVGGLAAAACLSDAGQRVLVLEREAAPPEPIGTVYALDPILLSRLRLSARGLRFVNRDLPLALPEAFSGPLSQTVLPRDSHAAAQAIAALSAADAKAWAPFRREVHAMARQLRRWWWSALEEGAADWMLDRASAKACFARLSLTGADAFLATHFESEALIAALLFDACLGGLHVSEPGSALALVWRVAQEMGGLEGAAAVLVPGTLVWSLIKAAGDTNFRCCTTVTGITSDADGVTGVTLSTGETIASRIILSSLSGRATQSLMDGTVTPAAQIGEARLLLSLRQKIDFPATRLILAERPGIYADAHEAARDGRLGAELPMEFSPAGEMAGGVDRIAVTVRPVPAALGAEDRLHLAARVVQALSRHVPGAAALISGVRFAPPDTGARATLSHLLAPSRLRVKTGKTGLYLCGADAEPLTSVSGRAARIAAGLILDGAQK